MYEKIARVNGVDPSVVSLERIKSKFEVNIESARNIEDAFEENLTCEDT